MKTASKLVLAAATALTLGLAAVAVNAHPGAYGPGCAAGSGGGPGSGPMGMGPGMGGGFGPGMHRGPGFGNPAAIAEGHLAWLKAELKITAAQEPAWQAFAEQRRQQAETLQASMKGLTDKVPATAVERLELRNQWAKQRQEQGEKMTASFKSLYAALTPEQRSLVDQGWAGRRGPHGVAGRGR